MRNPLLALQKSALPFGSGPVASAPPPARVSPPSNPPPSTRAAEEDLTGTVAVKNPLFGVQKPALPFAAADAPQPSRSELPPAPPGKRWARFDPQTGQPLATPILVDVPPNNG